MKYFVTLVVLALFAALSSSTAARIEPVCGYMNSRGRMIFMMYFPSLGHGQQYVETDRNGNCIKKVSCLEDFSLKHEDCTPEDAQRRPRSP